MPCSGGTDRETERETEHNSRQREIKQEGEAEKGN